MKRALVVTTINKLTEGIARLAIGAATNGVDFYVIGDVKTPDLLLGGSYYSIEDQRRLSFGLARVGPSNSYTRKNVGYLLAMRSRADVITETDDDNLPLSEFWDAPLQRANFECITHRGWVNVYGNFTRQRIWPRGLPLDEIDSYAVGEIFYKDCPIQQGLAEVDPDVDAVYRLCVKEPIWFNPKPHIVALEAGAWCPFNSQNTTWFRDAFPLMYLPSTCTFRMTDIWRSFVAQRILWTQGQSVLFHSPTVVQERNKHDLMDDFRQEIPGYLHNKKIAEGLMSLNLMINDIPENMRACYEWFVRNNLLDKRELELLDYWLKDVERLR